MATVFSTATLGLSVDNKEFNKAIQSSEKSTVDALLGMQSQTEAFHARWKEMTGGLKDTKRIISGILVSQGFYALSNALVDAASAALEFSMNMETAAVSLEYFVDAAVGTEEAAAQVQAYLREVNNFAAKTPFSTDDVLTLSKYMQAVGVAMGQTQSVLSVITDTAAATGATQENLQRITFALGQMLTKGRIANEEIRQLANANIPIYQILQEELGLTGDQISNIGNYWIDAETAVVAILNGLNKRYAGASDKIAETLTGLTDTIVDDAKIIADTAFGGIYDKITSVAGTLRDTLDEWRTIVTEQGAAGLANHLLITIDPSGELGNEILALIGNLKQLGASIKELYTAAKPIIKVFGQSLYASINLATIALTGITEVVGEFIQFLDDAGISTSTFAKGIASLYIAYKATQFVSLLGQACAAAGVSAYEAASGIAALLPASLTANAGITTLVGSVATLIAYLLTAVGIFGALSNSFAGLENGGTGLNDSWEKAYAEYAEQMEAYNAAIAAQQEQYRQDYTDMADGTTVSVDKDDDDDDDSSGSSSSSGTQDDWVAAFDEVYDVPNEDETGSYQDEVLADLGDLLDYVADFKFPQFSMDLPDMPTLGNIYGDSLWDDGNFFQNLIPAIAAGLVLGAGKVFAKQREKLKTTTNETIEKGGKGSTIVTDAEAEAQLKKLLKQIETGQEQLEGLFEQLSIDTRKAKTLDGGTQAYAELGTTADAIERLQNALTEQSADATYYAKLLGKQVDAFKLTAEQQLSLQTAKALSIAKRLETIDSALQNLTSETASLAPTLKAEREELQKRLVAITGRTSVSGTNVDYVAAVQQLEDYGHRLDKAITSLAEQPFTKEEGKPRIYNEKALQEINETLTDGQKALDAFKELYAGTQLDVTTRFEEAVSQLKAIDKNAIRNFKTAYEEVVGFNTSAKKLGETVIKGINTANSVGALTEKNISKIVDKTIEVADEMRKLTPEAIAEATAATQKAAARKAEVDARMQADAAAREARRAELKAERDAELKLVQGERRGATARRFDAAVTEPGNATKAVAAIESAAADTQAQLEALRDELSEYVSARNDFLSYGDTAQVEKITKSIEATKKQIAQLEGNLTPRLTADARELAKLTAEQSATVLSIKEKLDTQLTPAPGIAEQTAAAIESWRSTIPESVLKYLSSANIPLENLALTATKTVTALNGVSSWGATFPQLMAEAFKEQGWYANKAASLPDPRFVPATDRGVVLEKYFGTASAINLSAENVNVHQGGHAAREGAGLIVQYDFAASGDFSKLFSNGTKNGIAAIDIKTVSAATVDKLRQLSTPVAKGLYKADSSVLALIGRTDNMYELLAQSWVFSGTAGHQFASFVDTDFDFAGLNEGFVNRVIQAYNNSAYKSEGEALGGRIFSNEAYNWAAKTHGGEYSWAQYDADIIAPMLMDIKSGFNFDKLSEAVTTVALDYSKLVNAVDMPALAKAYTDNAMLFAALGDKGSQFLTSYASTLDELTKITGAIDLTPAFTNVTKATKSLNTFARQVLRDTSVGFTGGAVGQKFRAYLDKLVSDYALALGSGTEAATATFTSKVAELKKAVDALQRGESVTDDYIDLFGRIAKQPTKYRGDLELLSNVLDSLTTGADDVNKLVSTMYSVRRGISQLQVAANTGSTVYSKSLDGLITNYKALCNMLNLSNDAMAIKTGNELQAIQRFIKEAGGEATLNAGWVSQLQLPISFANIYDAAQYAAESIAEGLANGTVTLGKRAGAAVEELLSNYSLTGTPVASLLAQLEAANKLPENLVVGDFEATGFLKTTGAGTIPPYVTQATLASASSDKMLNRYIITGDMQQDYANFLRMQSITNDNGTLSDVAKAWQGISFDDYLANGVTMQQFIKEAEDTFGKGFGFTGWNATGTMGYDEQLARYAADIDGLFTPVEDVMQMFSNAVQEATGRVRSFKLVDAYEILFGNKEITAHLSDSDVAMTKEVLQALQSGEAQKLLATADPLTIGKGNLVDNLKKIGEAYREPLEAATRAASTLGDAAIGLDNATGAADDVYAGLQSGVKALAAGADDVAEAAAETASAAATEQAARSTFAESFERVTSGIKDSVKEWFSGLSDDNRIADLFKRLTGKTSRASAPFYETDNEAAGSVFERVIGKNAEPIYRALSLDELANNWTEAALKLEDAKEALANAKITGEADDVIDSLQKAVDDAVRASDDAMTGLYRGIINNANDAIKASSSVDVGDTSKLFSSWVDYGKAIDQGADYIALYWDKASRTFKTVGETLNISGSEMVQRLTTSLSYISDTAGYLDELTTAVVSGEMSASTVVKHLDALADITKVSRTADLDAAFAELNTVLTKNLTSMDNNIAKYIGNFTKDLPNHKEVASKLAELVSDVKQGKVAVSDFIDEATKIADSFGLEHSVKLSKTLNDIADNLDDGLSAVHQAAKNYAETLKPELSKAANNLSDSINDFIKASNNGKVSAQALEEFANTFDDEVADTLLILNKSTGETEFAGKTAREAVEQAANDLSEGIGSLTKKILTTSYGMFGVFDIIGVGIDSVIEALNVEKLQEQTGLVVASLTSEKTQAMFEEAKVNLEDRLGDTVYSGIEEALGQSVLVTLISNGIGTAVGLGIAGAASAITGATVAAFTGPVGWIAAAATAIAAIGSTAIINATGGNTDSYKYWDEYAKAVSTGEFIDVEGLIADLKASGYSDEEAKKAADEANEAAHTYYYQDIVNNASTDSFWEHGNVSQLLHGNLQTSSTSGVVTGAYNDILRLAQAAGLIDVGSQTLTDDAHGQALSRTVLTVKDEAQLDTLAELLGVEREALSISSEIVDTQNIHGYPVSTNTGSYKVLLNGKEIGYSATDMDLLADAYQQIAANGFISGEVGQAITETIGSNEMLKGAYGNITYGSGNNYLTAQSILEDYLKSYNAANNGNLTADYIDEIGATQSILQNMVDTYEAQSSAWYNEALKRTEITSENRNILSGDTATMLNGVDITNWSQSLLDELSSYGLNFAAGQYTANAYGQEYAVDYATLTTDYAALRENLAGALVDGSELNISSLQITAADAEILAQAGIQINSDGTISFMYAQNEGSTGNERDLSLGAEAFSKNVLNALEGIGVSVNFEAGELSFDNFTDVKDKMYAALFKMPDNISAQLSDEMRNVISQIGTVTDSGFLQITNKAVLSGEKTIASFIEEAGITVDELSPQVYDALMTIDAVIQNSGDDIQQNIIDWANGVVVPSPIKEEQLTEEMRQAFEAIGISFETYGDEFMMIIEQTGEKLTNGITLVDADKWNELDNSVKEALENLGVTATEYGNQMMIDLNGVFDGGVANIISLFINQPEVWDQIPDSVKAILENTGIITGDELIQIQTTLSGGLTEITDGWVTSWSTLGPTCQQYLDEAGISTTEGLAQITKYVGDANIGEVVDNGVVVPYEELPGELKEQLELAGENVEGTRYILKTATETAVGDMLSVLDQTVSDAEDYANELGTTIETAVLNAMAQLQNLQQLQSQVGSSGGFLGIGSKDNLIDYTGTTVGSTTYYKEYTTKGKTVKYWYIDSSGQWQSTTSLPNKAEGGQASGLTLTGELGDELAILPDGSVTWVTAGVYDLPDGTQIINAEDSAMVAKYAGRISSLNKLADGNTELSVDEGTDEASIDEVDSFIEKLKEMLLEVFFGVSEEEDTAALHSEQEEAAETTIEALSAFLQPLLQTELRDAEEITAVAIKNATSTLLETGSSDIKTLVESYWSQYTVYSDAHHSEIISAIDECASAVSSCISSMQSTISSLSSSLSSLRSSSYTISSSDEDRSQYGGSSYDQTYMTTAELKAAAAMRDAAEAGETTWAAAHEFVENLRSNYGYSGSSDGSAYIKLAVDTDGNVDVKYSGSTISANAYGSLITDDTILRAGEFGKEEAIIPLEQPSVMARLGTSIADSLPAEDKEAYGAEENIGGAFLETEVDSFIEKLKEALIEVFFDTTEEGLTAAGLQEIIKTELYDSSELISIAIKNAVETLSEDNNTRGEQLITQITSNHEGLLSVLEANKAEIIDTMTSAANQVAQSVGSYVSSLQSTISSLSSALSAASSSSSSEDRSQYGGSVYDQQYMTTAELKSAAAIREAAEAGETTWKEAHDYVESLRSNYGYSGSTDGSAYVKIDVDTSGNTTVKYSGSTISANAYGGIITDDTLLRAGEFGKEEAILPLEQPSVMAKLGTAIGEYTEPEEVLITPEILQAILQTELYDASEIISIAIKNASEVIGSDNAANFDRIINILSTELASLGTSNAEYYSGIVSAIDGAASSIASSVGSAISSVNSSLNNLAGSYGSSSSSTSTTSTSSGSTVVFSDVVKATGSVANAFTSLGYVKNSSGHWVKGSARGSLITEDALYRAGEYGLNEAIIPLEQPDVLRQVGSTIASYMPVEAVELSAAVGMKDGGITTSFAQQPTFDPSAMVQTITQHVLESVLPAMSNTNEGTNSTPVYVGTLVADDKGLKQLERKLYKIRQLEDARRQ